MSLTTHVGGAESNSFCLVTQAEDWLADVYGADLTNWLAMPLSRRELFLMAAAEFMAYLPLRGDRSYRNQRLCFPRTCQQDPSVLPDEVWQAQAVIALDVVYRWAASEYSAPELGDVSGDITSFGLGGVLQVAIAGNGNSVTGGVLSRLSKPSSLMLFSLLKPYLTTVKARSVRREAERIVEASLLLTTTTTP